MELSLSWGLIALMVTLIGLVELTRAMVGRLWRSAVASWRLRRAAAGERRAEVMLERRGWRIIERQPRRPFRFAVDGATREVELRADLLVARRGRLFVAEVKTGSRAPRIETSSTRRQLLEYRVAYREADGVLLVDAENDVVSEVVFPLSGERRSGLFAGFFLGIGLGFGLCWLVVELELLPAVAP